MPGRETDPRAVVYYIRRGSMVKIGTTVDLRGLMAALLSEEVLAVKPGDQKLEVERHRTFHTFRVPGQREWFFAGREVQDRIREVLAQHAAACGPAHTAIRRWHAERMSEPVIVDIYAAALSAQQKPGTIHQWLRRGRLTHHGNDRQGRPATFTDGRPLPRKGRHADSYEWLAHPDQRGGDA